MYTNGPVLKDNLAIRQSKKSIILAHAYLRAREKLSATLSDDYGAGLDRVATELLNTSVSI